MPRVVDVTLPLVRLVLTRKRWGASANLFSIRVTVAPGAYCYFDWRAEGFRFLFDNHHFKAWRYRHWLNGMALGSKLRLW
jgi:hypothetical protein